MARRNRDLVQILDEHERAIRRLKQSLARAGGGGVADHGALTGLADNDHPQYALLTGGADAIFTGNVAINDGFDPTLSLEGTIAGGYWAGSVEFVNTDGATSWRIGQRGASDAGDGGNLLFEYYTGSAWEEWLMFDFADDTARFGMHIEIYGALANMGMQIFNTAGWGIIELGGTNGGIIDFKNVYTDDYDIRLIQNGDSQLDLRGGGFAVEGHLDPFVDNAYDLGDTSRGWNNLYLAASGGVYFGGSTGSGLVHDGSNMILWNDTGGHLYLDARVDNSDVNLRATNGTTLRTRVHVDGNANINFYNRSAALRWEIGDNHVRFYDEMYGTASMTSTGSSAHLAIVHNVSSYQFYRFTSRRDVKENIEAFDPSISEGIYDLKVRTFDMREANRTGDAYADFGQHGLIADEAHAVFGDQFAPPDENGEPSGWSDRYLAVMLLSEAQKAKLESIAQDARISRLEAALHRLNK